MRKPRDWRAGLTGLTTLAAVLAACPQARARDAGAPAAAEQAPAALDGAQAPARSERAAAAAEHLDLDTRAFLRGPDVLIDQLEDAVWTVAAGPDRRLLLVPFAVQPGKQTQELDAGTLKMRGGRFLCWLLEDESSQRSVGTGGGGAAMDEFGPRAMIPQMSEMGPLGPMGPGAPRLGVSPPPGFGGPPSNFSTATTNIEATPPRLTRSVTIEPDGRISWPMDRFIPAGTVKAVDNVYCLKIRSELLYAKEPTRSPREPLAADASREARAQHFQRLREESERHRQEQEAFAEVRRQVMEAPTKFEDTLPPRIWAVFELNPFVREVTLEGPAPLPWQLSMVQLESLRAPSQAGGGQAATVTREALDRLQQMIQMVQTQPHPLSLRAAAVGLVDSGLIALSQPGDAVDQLSRKIVAGDDAAARAEIIRHLLVMPTPTPMAQNLLREAARSTDPTTQILALRGLLRGGPGDQGLLKLLVDTANRVLHDPAGPPASQLLAELFEIAGSGGASASPGMYGPAFGGMFDAEYGPAYNPAAGAGQAQPQVLEALAAGVGFTIPDAARREQAHFAVLVNHNAQPLAAQWLDKKLLGSDDAALVHRTLEIISHARLVAAGGAPAIGSAPGAMPPGIFPGMAPGAMPLGAHQPHGPGPAAEPSPSDALAARIEQADGQQRLVLMRGLLIAAADHALFKLLRHENVPLQQLAWQALGNFDLAEPGQEGGGGDQARAGGATPHQALVDAALAQDRTPSQVVSILERPASGAGGAQQATAATAALARLAALGDDAAARRAARALLGSNRPLEQAMQTLTPEDCHRFAQRLYEIADAPWPMVTGLLRDRGRIATLAPWFARAATMGVLPEPAAWIQTAGGTQAMMEMVMASDEGLSLAAAAALVAEAGGTPQQAADWSAQLRAQSNRSPEYAVSQWPKLRKEIFAKRLVESSGAYRLTARLYSADSGVQVTPPPDAANQLGPTWEDAMYGPQPGFGGPPPGFGGPPPGMYGGAAPPGSAWGPGTARPLWEEPLGVMQLVADGTSVKFANQTVSLSVPEVYLAIRVEKLVELKNFASKKLAELPLERSDTPMDLRPQTDGSWMGRARLADEQVLELLMEPVPQTP